MTRLRQRERQVLDTLVDAGVARSRSEALAWCVKLVGQHTDEWLQPARRDGRGRQAAGRRPRPVTIGRVRRRPARPRWNAAGQACGSEWRRPGRATGWL